MRRSVAHWVAFSDAVPMLKKYSETFLERHVINGGSGAAPQELSDTPESAFVSSLTRLNYNLWLSEAEVNKIRINAERAKEGQSLISLRTIEELLSVLPLPQSAYIVLRLPKDLWLCNMDQVERGSEVLSQIPHTSSNDLHMSFSSKTPYKGVFSGSSLQARLTGICEERGFHSRWWISPYLLQRERSSLRYGERPIHIMKMYSLEKLVHISQIPCASEVLLNLLILEAKRVIPLFTDNSGSEASATGASYSYCIDPLALREHRMKHLLPSPVFLGMSVIRAYSSLTLLPGVVPFRVPRQNGTSTLWGQHQAGSYGGDNFNVVHLYHASQIVLPDDVKLHSELPKVLAAHPGQAVSAFLGCVLDLPQLQPENLLRSATPELAAVVAGEGIAPGAPEAHNRSEGTSAGPPPDSSGRSPFPGEQHMRQLWFAAHDVLKLGGIVDVNAVPVEVTTSDYHRACQRGAMLRDGLGEIRSAPSTDVLPPHKGYYYDLINLSYLENQSVALKVITSL